MNGVSEQAIAPLLEKLDNAQSVAERSECLQRLSDFYTFTDVEAAQGYLSALSVLLEANYDPETALKWHLNTAIIDNQLYAFDTSKQHFEAATQLADTHADALVQAEVAIDFAGTLLNLKQMERALDVMLQAKKRLSVQPNVVLSARLMCREGYLWLIYSDFDKATELLFNAEKILGQIDDKDLTIKDLYFQTLIHAGLGLVFEKTGDTARCIHAYRHVIAVCEFAGIHSRLAWHYVNVGKAYMNATDYDNAEQFFEKAMAIKDDLSESARAHAMANLGYCHYLNDRFDAALDCLNKAEQIYQQKSHDFDNLSVLSRWKALLFQKIGETARAESRFVEALAFAAKSKDWKQQAAVCRDIAEFYAQKEDFRNAYDYQILHSQFVRRYYEEINKVKVDELEFKYEAERRQKEAELLRLQATGLQMKALRAQMNPHFIFNALNAIQHHIHSDNRDFAGKYLTKFAKMMRMSLEYSENEVISLEDEIAFLDVYLNINQKLRFEDRLSYTIEVDDDIEADISGVPTMIAQPYIENAIEHGLRPTKGGHIRIAFEQISDDLVRCTVEDNGIGREKAREQQARDGYHLHHKSRGTAITENRLKMLLAPKNMTDFITFTDLKHPETGLAAGTRVDILMPIVPLPFKGYF